MRVTYPQLDDEALEMLLARLDYHGNSRAALAKELGVSRSAISQALDRKYPGDTRKLRAKIIDHLAAQVACPHLGVDLAPAECKSLRERPLSAASASPADVKHWQACQHCRHNPARRIAASPASTGETP